MKWHLVFPFLSSLLYVVGVLLIKRSSDLRVGVWRTTFVSNLMAAGLDGLIFNLPDAHDLESVALAGEILSPLLKK